MDRNYSTGPILNLIVACSHPLSIPSTLPRYMLQFLFFERIITINLQLVFEGISVDYRKVCLKIYEHSSYCSLADGDGKQYNMDA